MRGKKIISLDKDKWYILGIEEQKKDTLLKGNKTVF